MPALTEQPWGHEKSIITSLLSRFFTSKKWCIITILYRTLCKSSHNGSIRGTAWQMNGCHVQNINWNSCYKPNFSNSSNWTSQYPVNICCQAWMFNCDFIGTLQPIKFTLLYFFWHVCIIQKGPLWGQPQNQFYLAKWSLKTKFKIRLISLFIKKFYIGNPFDF